ncbi:polysaccharide deacetylase family protein [Neobacillus drentensis]|uniref:polysaccharide deacetylase family protein n=1 Tax=Neobacillus drentensis TaxID=220684 RepID=UPI002FFF8085
MFRKISMVFHASLLVISTGFFSANTTKAAESTTSKVVYLTFDDGPNRYTPKILDILKRKKAHATFFMIEGIIKRNPKTVQRMIKEGNYPALHRVSHDVRKLIPG